MNSEERKKLLAEYTAAHRARIDARNVASNTMLAERADKAWRECRAAGIGEKTLYNAFMEAHKPANPIG